MHIKTDQPSLDLLKDKLNNDFIGKPYTETTIEKIQDTIEHALVSYSPEDIKNEQFLNPHLIYHTNPKRLQLFITTDIFIDVAFRTNVVSDFTKITKIEDIKVLDAGS